VTDVIVRGTATRWVDDRIEVTLSTASGKPCRIVEEVSVLTSASIPTSTSLPRELWIAGTSVRVNTDSVDVVLTHDVANAEGERTITVATDDVVWL
jgi:hypothetical protein